MPSGRPVTTRARRSLIALCGAAILLAAGAATPLIAHGSAKQAKRVSASIAYTDGSKSNVPVWKNIEITIKLDDEVVVDKELLPAAARESVFSAPKLIATDLDDDGEGEVLVDVFTAGADCCRRTAVYRRSGDGYAVQVLRWADTGYRLADVTGQSSPEFLASDSRFPRAWDSDARGPLRIFALRGGKVRDISPRVRKQLLRDARSHLRAWRSIRRKGGDARPVVAAYIADLVRIDEFAAARAALRNASDNDELRTSRQAFARSLDRKLQAWGYTDRRVLSR